MREIESECEGTMVISETFETFARPTFVLVRGPEWALLLPEALGVPFLSSRPLVRQGGSLLPGRRLNPSQHPPKVTPHKKTPAPEAWRAGLVRAPGRSRF